MKPFNLEEALAGKPVVTRDGRKVTEIYHFKTTKSSYPVHACIDKRIHEFTETGTYYDQGGVSEHDLKMEEPIVEGWVNIYYSSFTGIVWVGDVWPTYETAKNADDEILPDQYYIKTIKIDNQPE